MRSSRHLVLGAMASALLALTTCIALRAADPAVLVAAIAGLVVLLSWYAGLHATEEHPALGIVNPAAATTLAAAGRRGWGTMLPVYAAHAVGGVGGGLGGFVLADGLGDPLVFDASDLVVAGAGAAVVGLVGGWATLAVDGGGTEGLTAVPVVVAGALPLGLVGAFSPSVVLGLAAGDLLPWPSALVAAGAGLVGAALAGWTIGALLPRDVEDLDDVDEVELEDDVEETVD